jgi:hypothetical protein
MQAPKRSTRNIQSAPPATIVTKQEDSMYDPRFLEDCFRMEQGESQVNLMPLLRSQETVATIGSMNTDFMALMSTGELVKWDANPEAHPMEGLLISAQVASLVEDADFALDGVDWPQKDEDSSDASSTAAEDEEEDFKPAAISTKRTVTKARSTAANKRRIRCRPNYTPKCPTYVEPADEDVICQRGGAGNKHPGNIRYLETKSHYQVEYQTAEKSQVTAIAQRLVDEVNAWGGRFLKKDKLGWYEIHNHTARTKAGQALREFYTTQDRAEKRARYSAKKKQQRK